MLTKTIAVRTELKADKGAREVHGFASVYNVLDSVRDRVRPGAFTKTLQERGPSSGRNKIKTLLEHRTPGIGRLVHAEDQEFTAPDGTRQVGLHTVSRISKTFAGDEALVLIEDEVLDAMSIGYDVFLDQYDSANRIRDLLELKLYEVSYVTFPANEATSGPGLQVKSLADLDRWLGCLDFSLVGEALKSGSYALTPGNIARLESALQALQEILSFGRAPEPTEIEEALEPLEEVADDGADTEKGHSGPSFLPESLLERIKKLSERT